MNIYAEPKIDCHLHVFDPLNYPYAEDTPYRPTGQEIGTPAQLMQVMSAYGVRHALAVGPTSGYGVDNSCLLDAIARSEGRLKGIAVVSNDAPLSVLAHLKEAGIVGVALNPAMLGVEAYADAASLLDKLAELDLFAQVQVQQGQLPCLLPMLENSEARLLIDHCGRPEPRDGIAQSGFQALLALGRSERAVVKLSGCAKFSALAYPYTDAEPFVQALIEAFSPARCVWGSDWPFLRAPERIDYGPMLALAERWLPDPVDRHQVLWRTPARLFGFDETLR